MSMEKQLEVDRLEALGLIASAVLTKAIEDWRMLTKKKAWNYPPSSKRSAQLPNAECNFDELRVFFKSGWCEHLCSMISDNVCKETILKILEQELKEAMGNNKLSTAV